MKCLVIGGSGFIGQALVNRLGHQGHQITVLDVKQPVSIQANVDYLHGSYGDSNILSDLLPGHDICFHLASTTTPATSDQDVAYDLSSNVGATIELLNACVKARLPRFFFLSSGGTVYGPPDITPTPENHSLKPICAYGVSKLAIENYLRVYKITRGLDYKIARLSNPYGPLQPTARGQGVIPVFIKRAIANEKIQVWGDGSVVRDFVYIDDVVRGIDEIAFSNSERSTYNLGSGKGASLREILFEIQKLSKWSLDIEYLDSRSFDVQANILDCSAIWQDLGWRQEISFEDGIQRTFYQLADEN